MPRKRDLIEVLIKLDKAYQHKDTASIDNLLLFNNSWLRLRKKAKEQPDSKELEQAACYAWKTLKEYDAKGGC